MASEASHTNPQRGDLPGRRDRHLTAMAIAIVTSGALLHVFAGYSQGTHVIGLDDAFISYRYAANLLAGHGLVFNPGEYVEGFTNLLFTLLSATLLALTGPDRLPTAVGVVNAAFLVVALVLFVHRLRRDLPKREARTGTLLFAFCPSLWAWAGAGLEAIAVLTITLALWNATAELKDRALAILAVTCVAMRADGFVLVGAAVLALCLNRSWRSATRTAAAGTATLLALTGWRLLYYGDPLPNTYYAKVDGPLWERIITGSEVLVAATLATGLGAYILLLIASSSASRRTLGASPALRSALVFSATLVTYFLAIGGDHFLDRFLLALYPLGIYAALHRVRGSRPAIFTAGVVALLTLQLAPIARDTRFDYSFRRYDPWIQLGLHLRERHPESTLATTAAGKIAFYSGLRTIDMLGLADRHIAHRPSDSFENPGHNKRDDAYVLRRQPNLIAGWVTPDRQVAGISETRYRQKGYRLRWLIDMSRHPAHKPILDVTAMEPAGILEEVRRTYRFGVIERPREP